MTTFQIRHRTRYTYDGPVELGLHRLMVRPRDGHDMRIIESSLIVTPAADVRWSFDTFGNSVTHLTFHEPAEMLQIDSELTVRRYGFDEPLDRLARHAEPYPFVYDVAESVDLGPLIASQFPDDRSAVEAWIEAVIPIRPTRCLELLNQLGDAIHRSYTYGRREERGTPSPGETIAVSRGTCRDFALLFMEAARALGFAARFVTGYLHDPNSNGSSADALSGGGSTHAWADVFIPGVGWTEFDPTNRIVAGRNLLRVATTRTPSQAVPVSGVYRGAVSAQMHVDVAVHRLD
jgi:transglutaminase-like putative cysteine protease